MSEETVQQAFGSNAHRFIPPQQRTQAPMESAVGSRDENVSSVWTPHYLMGHNKHLLPAGRNTFPPAMAVAAPPVVAPVPTNGALHVGGRSSSPPTPIPMQPVTMLQAPQWPLSFAHNGAVRNGGSIESDAGGESYMHETSSKNALGNLENELEAKENAVAELKLQVEALTTAITLGESGSGSGALTADGMEMAHRILTRITSLRAENERLMKLASSSYAAELEIVVDRLKHENEELKRKVSTKRST